ncbi:hypothetical protein [Vampirovibrio sp.]|uniref:hypothetical protein n=1 Tax=Vampirovibrio sp. TaxID=2717857 RepID=UPI0035947E78
MSPQSPQPRKRASKQEMLEREQEVISMIIHGFSKTQVLQTLIGQGFHEKKARRAYDAAMKTVAGLGNQSTAFQLGKVTSQLDHIYKHATVGPDKDYNLALKTVDISTRLIPKAIGGTADANDTSLVKENSLSAELEAAIKRQAISGAGGIT